MEEIVVTESSVVEEPETFEPVAEPEAPVVQAPPTQSTSRWAEVLFGSKDEEDDK